MQRFATVEQRAKKRHGASYAADLPKAKSARALKAVGDDRYLAEMTRRVFSAGFVWKVIDAKWAGFEEAFLKFDPAYWSDPPRRHLAMLVEDTRIVRNRQKIESVPKNAAYIAAVAAEHGSFGAYVAAWPSSDIVGLFADMKKRGGRLGGATAQYLLRRMGKDTFVLTGSVLSGLCAAGVLSVPKAASQRDLSAVQDAFNAWHDETGRTYGALSLILARSVPN